MGSLIVDAVFLIVATGYVPGPPKPPRSTQLFKDTLTSQAKKFKTRRESMDKAPITGQVSPIKSPLKVRLSNTNWNAAHSAQLCQLC